MIVLLLATGIPQAESPYLSLYVTELISLIKICIDISARYENILCITQLK